MQFIKNGPDVPERLLQAHEDGRVVFFCGAGISYPARLPGFKGLVQRLYAALGETPNPVQQAAIRAKQFDTAISLLETGIVGGRAIVRRALADILTPDLTARNATATHEALLTLGKNREGRTRLITTNFDRLFEEVIAARDLKVESFKAPLLPVPKNRWDGLVYLHGLIPAPLNDNELDCLVVSSGDFGLAYLTERWAARFVSELFRNYTVCFIGYSINDPVLRYMMDALAADRLLGESHPEMFAFGSYSNGKEGECANDWRAKNVTPILYREHNRHTYLQKTLRAWAKTYRDGVQGKERVVVECAMARPLASTEQDDFVGRLLWALSDPRGLPARRFADLDPVPSLEWLGPLSEERYQQADLVRFGVQPKTITDDKLSFSLTRRPSPYDLSPLMVLVDVGAYRARWDDVMRHLARWLLRYLDDPTLLLWLVKRGGQLHEELARNIDDRLNELAKLERDGNTDELNRIRTYSPKAIPRPMMRSLWRLLLTGRLRARARELDLYDWQVRFNCEGLTTTSRLELREILTPRVMLRDPIRWPGDHDDESEPQRLKDLVEWEVVLSTDHVHSSLRDLKEEQLWAEVLPDLLTDFSGMLKDALDLMQELGGADATSDRSYMAQPSISEHPQNKDFRDWTVLIELTRDSWLAAAVRYPDRARLAAESWWQVPYPLFKRLAFFATSHDNLIPPRRALDWLLTDDHWWLWSVETERESMRLLVVLAPKLDTDDLAELEQAILAGPPRAMFMDDIEPDRWAQIVAREMWLRLAKMAQTGASLHPPGEEMLQELSGQFPEWSLAEDERDEFPVWMGGVRWVGEGEGDPWRTFVATPRRRLELIEWLKQHPSKDHWQEDDWRQRCRDHFATTAWALRALAREGEWLIDRWREALQAWSEEKDHKRSWYHMGTLIADAPDHMIQTLAHSISWWLKAIAKTFEGHEREFLVICRRILDLSEQDRVDNEDPVFRAINHPVGLVAQSLLQWWYRQSLEDGQGLHEALNVIFTEICNTDVEKFRHGRVLLAAHVITLFRVDRTWAIQHLLPLFDWQHSETEARAAWEGFLWSPRLYRPLMEVIKQPFLETARHYTALGEHDGQYAALLTFAALDPGDTFSTKELALATRTLPLDGLDEAAQALVRGLEGAGDQYSDYWKNRVVPYLHSIWPKSREHVSGSISESFGRLCIATQENFPRAFTMLSAWLQPIEHPGYLLNLLHKADICQKFPEPALDFLDRVIGDQQPWGLRRFLNECLRAIRDAAPELIADQRFQRLLEYLRRSGQELT